ncbi:hypothetical protein VNO78_25616 [Psophocarpus tetragonolobus]|uniref:Uncharacterized protein n=1 Tax=Psophocarpus tetragonolobus TaxID=3891 RepID=A0AAN9XFZ2_PSOTE
MVVGERKRDCTPTINAIEIKGNINGTSSGILMHNGHVNNVLHNVNVLNNKELNYCKGNPAIGSNTGSMQIVSLEVHIKRLIWWDRLILVHKDVLDINDELMNEYKESPHMRVESKVVLAGSLRVSIAATPRPTLSQYWIILCRSRGLAPKSGLS